MKWKSVAQKLEEAKNSALEKAQQYQGRINSLGYAIPTYTSTDELKPGNHGNNPRVSSNIAPIDGDKKALDSFHGAVATSLHSIEKPQILDTTPMSTSSHPKTDPVNDLYVAHCDSQLNHVHPDEASSPSSSHAVHDIISVNTDTDVEYLLNSESLDVLKQSLKSLFEHKKLYEKKLKECQVQHDAAKEVALYSAQHVQELKEKLADQESNKERHRSNTALESKYQQHYRDLYLEHQNIVRVNEELQVFRVELQNELRRTTDTLNKMGHRNVELEVQNKELQQEVIEQKQEVLRLNTIAKSRPPRLWTLTVSSVVCLINLPPLHTTTLLPNPLKFVETTVHQCQRTLEDPLCVRTETDKNLNSFYRQCVHLRELLSVKDHVATDVMTFREFLEVYMQCLDYLDTNLENTVLKTVFLLESSSDDTLVASRYPLFLSFFLQCCSGSPIVENTCRASAGLHKSLKQRTFNKDDEPAWEEDGYEQDSRRSHNRPEANSLMTIPVFTELLVILKDRTFDLQHINTANDIPIAVSDIIPVLETVEERIPPSAGRAQFSSAIRELFFNIVNLARKYVSTQNTLDGLEARQTCMTQWIQECRSMLTLPPTVEQLQRADLSGELIMIVPVALQHCKEFRLGCIQLKAQSALPDTRKNSVMDYATRSPWTPGVYWYPVSVLEKDVYWAELIEHTPLPPDTTKDHVAAMEKTLALRQESIELLKQDIRSLTTEYQRYKTKVSQAIKNVATGSKTMCCEAVQYCIEDVSFSLVVDNPETCTSQKPPLILHKNDNQLNAMNPCEVQDEMEKKTTHIRDLSAALCALQVEKQRLEEMLFHGSSSFQTASESWASEKKQYIDSLNHAQERIKVLTQTMMLKETRKQQTNDDPCSQPKMANTAITPVELDENQYNAKRHSSIEGLDTTGFVKDKPRTETDSSIPQNKTSAVLGSSSSSRDVDGDVPVVSLGSTGVYLGALRRALKVREHQLQEERAEKVVLEEQLLRLKKELHNCESQLGLRPFTVTEEDSRSSVPIAFVRHTILQFLLTGRIGTSDHESLIPVIASFFSFTPDEVNKIRVSRDRNSTFKKWLPVRYSS